LQTESDVVSFRSGAVPSLGAEILRAVRSPGVCVERASCVPALESPLSRHAWRSLRDDGWPTALIADNAKMVVASGSPEVR
jgi:hypothetical protein